MRLTAVFFALCFVGLQSYSDPAPGVHFTSATGVVGHTMRPGYPEPGAAKPQLVFSQPLYESNPDTQQLVEDI